MSETMSSNDHFKVFLFSKTTGYRHESIAAGIRAIQALGSKTNRFSVDATEDASLVTTTDLAQYAVVLFLQTSGDFLDEEQLASLQSYVRSGGRGFVGVHCASAGMLDNPWYGELIGAHFTDHPEPQPGTVKVEDKGHVIVSHLPEEWSWFEEWYNFTNNPREKVDVLLTIDEKCYKGGKLGKDHPLAWCREFEGCRSFYTSLGHFDEAYEDDAFMQHLLKGILWAARHK